MLSTNREETLLPQDQLYCPNCGTNNPALSKFCRQCGSTIKATSVVGEKVDFTVDANPELRSPALDDEAEKTQSSQPDPPAFIFCPECGYKNALGSRFCENDGALLKTGKPAADSQQKTKKHQYSKLISWVRNQKHRSRILLSSKKKSRSLIALLASTGIVIAVSAGLLIPGVTATLFTPVISIFSSPNQQSTTYTDDAGKEIPLITNANNSTNISTANNPKITYQTKLLTANIGNIKISDQEEDQVIISGSVNSIQEEEKALSYAIESFPDKTITSNIVVQTEPTLPEKAQIASNRVRVRKNPAELEKEVYRILKSNGFSDIAVSVDENNTAVLKGALSNDADKTRVFTLVNEVAGIKKTKDKLFIIYE